MPNTRTPWTFEDWNNIEKLGSDLAAITFEMNERIGSGGGNNTPENLINSAQTAERILARIKALANKY